LDLSGYPSPHHSYCVDFSFCLPVYLIGGRGMGFPSRKCSVVEVSSRITAASNKQLKNLTRGPVKMCTSCFVDGGRNNTQLRGSHRPSD
jgi:hypothetical protein